MHPTLVAVAARQRGVFTRQQAMEAGYRGPEIRTRLGPGGRWVAVRRGVHAEREFWEAADDTERWRMQDMAAHLTMSSRHAMSHDSAARALGLDQMKPATMLVHVTRQQVTGSRTEHGVKHHVSRVRPEELLVTDGLPHLGMARTAVDLAREHGLGPGVAVMDQVLRRGVTDDELAAQIAAQRHWPGVGDAARALTLADSGAENVGETIARLLVAEIGLGVPIQTQFPVRIGGQTAWIDLLVGCLAVELDGRKKYVGVAEGGVVSGSVADVVMSEKRRESLLQEQRLMIARITPEDFWGARRAAAQRRIRVQYDVATAAYGTTPQPELLAFAEQMSAVREERLRVRPDADAA